MSFPKTVIIEPMIESIQSDMEDDRDALDEESTDATLYQQGWNREEKEINSWSEIPSNCRPVDLNDEDMEEYSQYLADHQKDVQGYENFVEKLKKRSRKNKV